MSNGLPNNPYARPVNATRPEGQMLVGEFYGTRATDKQLAGTHGRQVSPANRFSGSAIAVPDGMELPPTSKPKRTRKRTDNTATLVEPQVEPTITEDDLFG